MGGVLGCGGRSGRYKCREIMLCYNGLAYHGHPGAAGAATGRRHHDGMVFSHYFSCGLACMGLDRDRPAGWSVYHQA
jgi:hypothetical protein